MKYKNTILIVKDLNSSKQFYKHILGLRVLLDFNGMISLSSGIVLQSYEIWKDIVHKKDDDIMLENYASELSFETEDIDDFMNILNNHNVSLVHPLRESAWGQREVRFYDPDGHIIKVSESMKKIVKRFLNQGLTFEEIANHIGIPLDYIKEISNHG